jgi:hypothetical protein
MSADSGFKDLFLHQIYLYPQEVTEVLLKTDDLDERERARVKLHQQVQVTLWSLFPTHIRAEYTKSAYPRSPHAARVGGRVRCGARRQGLVAGAEALLWLRSYVP